MKRTFGWLLFAAMMGVCTTSVACGEEISTATPKPHPITPPTRETIGAAIDRGVDFLTERQNKNGSWGSPRRTKNLNIYAPTPGGHHAFQTGTTSLGLMAMLEFESKASPDKDRAARVASAIDRGEAWLLNRLPRLRRANGDAIYNVWGHAYSIQALVRLSTRSGVDAEQLSTYRSLVTQQLDLLNRYHLTSGGWGYYDFVAQTKRPSGSPSSFTTATVLIAAKEAQTFGLELPEKTIAQSVASIRRQQRPDFSYLYGEYFRQRPMHVINRPGGSLGRSQVCNLALRQYGDDRITDEVLKLWLDRLFARNGWLSIGRKRPVPHESHFAVAGYFYYYGHFYAAMCIEELPEAERPYFQGHLAHILLPLQEKDGSWWDYPLYDYHQPYGTAMTVMALLRCR
jgi:hypothetical protein